MMKVSKDYQFQGPEGKSLALGDLFGDKEQLLLYHFMFAPDDEAGCHGCAFLADHFPDTRHLATKNTALVAVSRAPFAKLDAWKTKTGWRFPWYSSEGSDFNYDFHATLDEEKAPIYWNYMDKEELAAKGQLWSGKGERPGMSVFIKKDGEIFHTYSTYARGLDTMMTTLQMLDLTPMGRQDDPNGPGAYKFLYEYDEDA